MPLPDRGAAGRPPDAIEELGEVTGRAARDAVARGRPSRTSTRSRSSRVDLKDWATSATQRPRRRLARGGARGSAASESRSTQRIDAVAHAQRPDGLKIRTHGDYHLGQVLRRPRRWYDPRLRRRAGAPAGGAAGKQSPLRGRRRDAAIVQLRRPTRRCSHAPSPDGEEWKRLEPWAETWESARARRFLSAYLVEVARRAASSPPTATSSDRAARLLRDRQGSVRGRLRAGPPARMGPHPVEGDRAGHREGGHTMKHRLRKRSSGCSAGELRDPHSAPRANTRARKAPIVRAWRPGGADRSRRGRRRGRREARNGAPRRPVRRRRRRAARRLRARGRVRRRPELHGARPVPVPADPRRHRPAPRRRRAATAACGRSSARTCRTIDGVDGRRLRGVGAERT